MMLLPPASSIVVGGDRVRASRASSPTADTVGQAHDTVPWTSTLPPPFAVR